MVISIRLRWLLWLRPISTLNWAFNLILVWDLLSSYENWVILLKARVLRDGRSINYNISSSIWSIIKNELVLVTSNTRNILGNGCNTNFWLDSWCGPPLVNLIQNQENINTHTMVSDFLPNSSWKFPFTITNMILNLCLFEVGLIFL